MLNWQAQQGMTHASVQNKSKRDDVELCPLDHHAQDLYFIENASKFLDPKLATSLGV